MDLVYSAHMVVKTTFIYICLPKQQSIDARVVRENLIHPMTSLLIQCSGRAQKSALHTHLPLIPGELSKAFL